MISPQNHMKLTVYTRNPNEDYTKSLSNSIHFACTDDNNEFQPLNRNYGILLALATVDVNSVIHEKGLKNPYLFRTADGTFGIVAVRVDASGHDDEDSRGCILLWTSSDLVTFHHHGLVQLHKELYVRAAVCDLDNTGREYEIRWQDNMGNFYSNRLSDLTNPECISLSELVEAFTIERPDRPCDTGFLDTSVQHRDPGAGAC